MSRVAKLKAALAAVPADQPCTPAAVKALHTAGHAAAQHIAAISQTPQASFEVLDDCVEQGVPGACMPVLAWLAAGLRSGLPPAATQQAYAMACALLGVVTAVLPDHLRAEYRSTESLPRERGAVNQRLLQLGSTEALCQQLALVVAALLAAAFPGTAAAPTSTSTTSSSGSAAGPSLQQQASLSLMLEQLRLLLRAVAEVVRMDALLPPLISSGLYQVLLEGVLLLLLGADPAVYPQTPEMQSQLWDDLTKTVQAGSYLTWEVAAHLFYNMLDEYPGTDRWAARRPWLQPLFKLQLLLLAKMQWDVRQAPDNMSAPRTPCPWPAKTLSRALPQLRSPCVAGDLLRQRAPVLVQHTYYRRHQKQTLRGLRWEVKEEVLYTVPPYIVGLSLSHLARVWLCCKDAQDEPVTDAYDLGVLMEVAELYCVANPIDGTHEIPVEDVCYMAWQPLLSALTNALAAADAHVPTAFAATCGEALFSIAEYLVEDVLLVMVGEGPGAGNSADWTSSSSSRTGAASASTTSAASTSSSSSSSAQKLVTGGDNIFVTADDRLAWTRDVATVLGLLLAQQQTPLGTPQSQTGAASRLMNDKTAPRLRLLLETILRTPHVLRGTPTSLFYLLPRTLPALHAAASSSAGSRALLSATITATKRQRALNAALAALVQAQGVPAAAAAGVVAAVPGHTEKVLGEQFLGDPIGLMQAALQSGMQLLEMALELSMRAFALLDASLSPAAGYLATRLPPGQDSQLAGLEVLLATRWQHAGEERSFPYLHLLAGNPQQVEGILQQLTTALREWQDASEVKRAAKLAEKMGAAAAAEELRQKLVGTTAGTGSSADTLVDPNVLEELPCMLQRLGEAGYVQQGDDLAVGLAAQLATPLGPASAADRRVAATAVYMACKVAGAVVQLPQLLEQVQAALAKQIWRWVVGSSVDLKPLQDHCSTLALWLLLLAPVLGPVMPADQAAQLQEEAASGSCGSSGQALPTPEVASRLLDLLGHVAAPGAPGCSYPGCCNLEGRTEAELPVQACSKCKGVRYCCREHQVAHWKAGHKEVCRAAQAAAKQMCDVGS